MERIAIIGMGPLGASIGLGLKKAQLANTEIVGSSGDRDALSRAMKMGAVDQTTMSLGAAIDGAQLLILDMPVADMEELLEAIGPILEEGCVVTDTSATKIPVMQWADQHLPRGISFVGGHPLPKKLPQTLDEAEASIFEGVDYCVIPSKSADQRSVRTVVGLVERLGAKPLFLDLHEHDSYAAAMTYLPIVLSSAYVTATTGSEAWRDMHRLAASEFSEFSRFASVDPADNEAACLANPDALVHWLDQMIAELYSYRNQIKERSDMLLEPFIKAWEARARWEAGVVAEDNEPRTPSATESMASALVGTRLVERYREMTNKEKTRKSNLKYVRKK